jgi:LmbE family N-acetylglucosaminyl deacetylase
VNILLSPHSDDETLFAAYTCQQHHPLIVVCLRSVVQEQRFGITHDTRQAEAECAATELGCQIAQLQISDAEPDWLELGIQLQKLRPDVERVFAPAIEVDGHEQHNRVGEIALQVFGSRRVTQYLTYRRGLGRSTNGQRVVPEPDWVLGKLRALACYTSQVFEPSCQPWFTDRLDEYLVA